jgi:hypothetical protein
VPHPELPPEPDALAQADVAVDSLEALPAALPTDA